eukprot:m.149049 g.149049  ORF g.149049 m.149049 type:complete len:342 (-) comp30633_c2_seq1:268-1293(-)
MARSPLDWVGGGGWGKRRRNVALSTADETSKPSQFASKLRDGLPHLAAGAFSGLVATLTLHPLDLVKVRFQAQDNFGTSARGRYTGVLDAFRTIVRTEGARALYQGISPNAVGSASAWGSYFFMYEYIKDHVRLAADEQLSPQMHMGAALLASACTLTVTNPIWVVKTRMCLQVNPSKTNNQPSSSANYRGLWHGLRSIVHAEGVAGLYRGFVPGLFGTMHGSIQFVVYEELKLWRNQTNNQSARTKLPPLDYIALAAISKAIAVTTTYPVQVLRTRLQDLSSGHVQLNEANRAAKLIRSLYNAEGIRVFYRGLIPSLIRVMPATCITFVVYENVSRFLQD